MAMTKNRTDIPFELHKIPPSLSLIKGGVIIPPFLKGGERGL
jgi:hypothetical protein